jgi:segregation and condensation protein A
LMNIKSQMLLPTEEALPLEEFDDPRMDLVRRLKAYQIVKDVAIDLRNLEADAGRYLPRAYFSEFSESDLETVSTGEVSFVDFLHAFLRCVNRWEDVVHRVQAQKINLDDMISRIVKRLGGSEKITWRELLTETTNRMERILVLLALLEMSRQQQVTLRQTRPYGNLWVIPSQNYELQRAS